MTLLFCDSFDHYSTSDLAKKWGTGTGLSGILINSSGGRRGTQCFYFTGENFQGSVRSPAWSPVSTIIVGFALKPTNPDARGYGAVIPSIMSTGGNHELTLTLDEDSHKFKLMRGTWGGTLLSTGNTVLNLNQWYWIEMKATIDNSSGSFELKVDHAVDLTFSGDTQSVSNQITNIELGGGVWAYNYLLDDLYVCDTNGSINNDYLGDIKVEALFPDGAGSNTQWTPTAGANYQCVDESSPNDDTDYVYTNISGYYDTYSFDNLTTVSGEIFGVQTLLYSRKPDAGSKYIRNVVRPSTSEYIGSLHNIGDSYEYFLDMFETNPETTSGWFISEVNNAEFGIKSG